MWCFLTKMFQGVREVEENCRKAEGSPQCGGWQEGQGSTYNEAEVIWTGITRVKAWEMKFKLLAWYRNHSLANPATD